MKHELLRTPYFLIDREKIQANCRRVIKKANELGVQLRPHVKTHKTIEGALLQHGDQTGPIAVSTLAEAYFFAEHGFDDIIYGFPITPDKFADVVKLSRRSIFAVVTDSEQIIQQLNAYLEEWNIHLPVYLKIDAGASRAGFHHSHHDDIASAARLVRQLDKVKLQGVLVHAHHSYAAKSADEAISYIQQENQNLSRLITALSNHGITIPVVSTGSTPTTLHQSEAGASTEIRPGNYTLYDRFQSDIGSCRREDIAGFVVATVAGHYPERNQMLIDAGALAFSKDRGAVHLRDSVTYGEAFDHPELQVQEISQEHGLVGSESPIPFDQFPIGSQIKFIPNHSCLAAACFETYYIEEDGQLIDTWKPVKGW